VADGVALASRASNTDPKKAELLRYDVHGGLPPGVFEALRADRLLLVEVARRLLDASFPESLHEEIAAAVGLDLAEGTAPRRRDPAFRVRVLRAYEFRCAVCGYDLRLGDVQIGLEAAHIKWHQAGGPDEETNGLALCSLHHKAFDLGAFTIGDDLGLRLSASLHGGEAFERVFLAHHGRAIRPTPDPGHRPGEGFLAWHRREVFRKPERWVG
jgi:putative restriction endonuclease